MFAESPITHIQKVSVVLLSRQFPSDMTTQQEYEIVQLNER